MVVDGTPRAVLLAVLADAARAADTARVAVRSGADELTWGDVAITDLAPHQARPDELATWIRGH